MNPHSSNSSISVQSLKSFPPFSSTYKFSNYKDRGSGSDDVYSDYAGSYKDNYYDIFDFNSISLEEQSNPINQVLKEEAYSFDVERFAGKFLDALFLEAIRRLSGKRLSNGEYCPLFEHIKCGSSESGILKDTFPDIQEIETRSNCSMNVDWPKISEFNIKLGLEKLESYVSKWKRSDDWLFSVEFLGFECEDCANIFVFEVEWSKPTMSYPIPQATASVFFGLEVFKMLPYNYDRIVDVTYIFECSNVIHKPGRIDFQEKWLQDILDAKLKFFKSITFAVSNGVFTLFTGEGLRNYALIRHVKKSGGLSGGPKISVAADSSTKITFQQIFF